VGEETRANLRSEFFNGTKRDSEEYLTGMARVKKKKEEPMMLISY
jgi:hypothetical protein